MTYECKKLNINPIDGSKINKDWKTGAVNSRIWTSYRNLYRNYERTRDLVESNKITKTKTNIVAVNFFRIDHL